MTLYPDAQRKAQAEIDAVIGTDRLPDFEDRDQLPYVMALCNEVLRWMPAVPQGNEHHNDCGICQAYMCWTQEIRIR